VRYEDRKIVMRGRMPMEMVYCAQCHEARGLVTCGTPHIFFICDLCYFKGGSKAPEGSIELRN
jgi:hypothetical protein